MAIDTAAKRASVAGMIIPDGTLDQGDRQTIAGMYRGILAAASGIIRITSTVAVEFVAMINVAVEFVGMSNAVVEYIDQDVTVEGSS